MTDLESPQPLISHRERLQPPPEQLAAEALHVSPSLVSTITPEGRILFANTSFQKLFSLDDAPIDNPNIFKLLDDTGNIAASDRIRAEFTQITADNPQIRSEYSLPGPNGSDPIITGWTHTGIFDTDGNLLRVISEGSDITEKKAVEKKLINTAMHDSLTGLYSRAYYNEERTRLSHSRYPVGAFIIDVNGLKKVNDSSEDGHSEGDKLLIAVAKITQKVFRQSDAICRDQGDEFRVLLSDEELTEKVLAEKEQLLLELANEYNANKDPAQTWNVSFAVGWALCPTQKHFNVATQNLANYQDIVSGENIADKKMYIQKREYYRQQKPGPTLPKKHLSIRHRQNIVLRRPHRKLLTE